MIISFLKKETYLSTVFVHYPKVPLSKTNILSRKLTDHQPQHESKGITDSLQSITYSIYNVERTITGIMEEKENYIYLYEYRGIYTGTEFFISFSKDSDFYRLVSVKDL